MVILGVGVNSICAGKLLLNMYPAVQGDLILQCHFQWHEDDLRNSFA